jgi:hypothetical protein
MGFLYLNGNLNINGRYKEKLIFPRLQMLCVLEQMCFNTDVILIKLCFLSKNTGCSFLVCISAEVRS